jgi:hypothetical protein
MKGPKAGLLALVGVIISVIGVIAPILWDRYKVSSALELRCVSFETLVESSDQLEKLSITYDGKSLKQISKADFVLINAGRTPIIEKDVVSAPEITIPRDTEVLDVKIEAQQPENLGASVDFDRTRNVIVINFPLLNRDDYVRFGVFTNSGTLAFDAKARIAGISGLSVTERTPRTSRVGRRIPWTVYPVGFFSLLLFQVAVRTVVPQAVRQRRMKRSIKDKRFTIPESGTPETYLAFINTELSFATPGERGALVGMIKSFPAGVRLDGNQLKQVEAAFLETVRSAASSVHVLLILLGVSLSGLWYILAKIW